MGYEFSGAIVGMNYCVAVNFIFCSWIEYYYMIKT